MLARTFSVSESPIAKPRLRRATTVATPAAMQNTANVDQRALRRRLRAA
ncbi:MAG: hypothetical protein U0521_06660 [Anaerolineae bacterium]